MLLFVKEIRTELLNLYGWMDDKINHAIGILKYLEFETSFNIIRII